MQHLKEYVFLALGVGVTLASWSPLFLRRAPLSTPILFVSIGAAAGLFVQAPEDLWIGNAPLIESLAEVVVLVALASAGLKIDRRFSLRTWGSAWRLLAIAMPATIIATAWWAHMLTGWSWGLAFLAGAVLSPTDPVLASQVEVGPPGAGEEGEIRFALTAEASFNDGLAFPIVLLGVALAGHETMGAPWFFDQFGWRVVLSLMSGVALGRTGGLMMFRNKRFGLSASGRGMVALAVTFVSFAVTQLLGGYGFVAVFTAALAVRASCPTSQFHAEMNDFAHQFENLLLMLLLFAFGVALTSGLLAAMTWRDAAIAAMLIFVIRPLLAWLSLWRSPHPWQSRALTAFFGIRGVGAIYYLAYATLHLGPDAARPLWALTAMTVAASIGVHGITASPLMAWADSVRRRMGRRENAG